MKNAALNPQQKSNKSSWTYKAQLLLLAVAASLCSSPALSEGDWQALPPPSMDDASTPEVVITPRNDKRIREYRANGVLYMIEVSPDKGPSYILVDMDGDGSLETRRHAFDGDEMMVPRWTLLRW